MTAVRHRTPLLSLGLVLALAGCAGTAASTESAPASVPTSPAGPPVELHEAGTVLLTLQVG